MMKKTEKEEIAVNAESKPDFKSKYLRALADYQNLLKQTAQEKADFAKYANENLIRNFISVYDYLKLSLEHAPADNKWLEGVRHVSGQFKKALNEAGVEEIAAEGRAFNHDLMEAIETEETNEADKDGLVAKELKVGYLLNEKVIIPVSVVVFKYIENK